MWLNLRFALRMLLKQPLFTAVAVLTLAVGIGANTTVFCWIQAVLWRPVRGAVRPEELVALTTTHGAAQWDTVSLPDLRDYAALTNVFAGVIGSQITPACLSVKGRPDWIFGQIATANSFDVLGVKPHLGRFFLPDEDVGRGAHPVMVLSHGCWQRRFGADPAVVGATVELNKHVFTVIGVAPPEFSGTMSGLQCDFWAPLTMHEQVAHFGSWDERSDRWLHTQARLRAGTSIKQARAAVAARASQLAAAYPRTNQEIGLRVLPLWQAPYGGQALFLPLLRVLMAVSLAVLLIVAANLANLLLAQAIGRQKEIAIRISLGAGRRQLLSQLMTESLVLALLGGFGGLLVAGWAADLFRVFMPTTYLPIGYDFSLNLPALGFSLGLAILTGLVFGLVPALQSLRPDVHQTLKDAARGSRGAAHHRLRAALVVSEVALALMLLVGAGLCIRGFQKARKMDLGFDPRGTLVAGLRLGAHGYTEETAKVFYRQLRQRVAALPGVQEAALASWFPLGFEGGPSNGFQPESYAPHPNEDLSVPYSIVSPRYFAAMGIPILDGRDFTDQDDGRNGARVIINQRLAQRYWPGESAIGRRVKVGGREATVVGVAKSGRYRTLNEPPRPFLYLPYQQGVHDLNLGIVVRAPGEPLAMLGPLRREIQALDRAVETWAALSMADFVEAAYLTQRIAATLLMGLGAVALVLASIGIYGVMAYLVSQRTREIGIRMALGAQIGDVLRLVIGQGALLAGVGLAIGLLLTLAASRLVAGFLHGVSPFDPLTFLAVAVVLAGALLAACYLPARRAARVDPIEALRCE